MIYSAFTYTRDITFKLCEIFRNENFASKNYSYSTFQINKVIFRTHYAFHVPLLRTTKTRSNKCRTNSVACHVDKPAVRVTAVERMYISTCSTRWRRYTSMALTPESRGEWYKTARNCCSPGGNSVRPASGIWDVLERSLSSSSLA